MAPATPRPNEFPAGMIDVIVVDIVEPALAHEPIEPVADRAVARFEEGQVQRLAARVDSRMRAVASNGRTADSLRVAVLAALNLADELARAEERLHSLEGGLDVAESAHIRIRATNLAGLLDQVLAEEPEAAHNPAS